MAGGLLSTSFSTGESEEVPVLVLRGFEKSGRDGNVPGRASRLRELLSSRPGMPSTSLEEIEEGREDSVLEEQEAASLLDKEAMVASLDWASVFVLDLSLSVLTLSLIVTGLEVTGLEVAGSEEPDQSSPCVLMRRPEPPRGRATNRSRSGNPRTGAVKHLATM